jgi:hypothetical protein
MKPDKTFHITIVDTTHGTGIEASQPARIIGYSGQSVEVEL